METGVKITQVVENTAAFRAGLQVNDQLIAFDNWQVSAEKLSTQLDRYPIGESIILHIIRSQKLKKLNVWLRQYHLFPKVLRQIQILSNHPHDF